MKTCIWARQLSIWSIHCSIYLFKSVFLFYVYHWLFSLLKKENTLWKNIESHGISLYDFSLKIVSWGVALISLMNYNDHFEKFQSKIIYLIAGWCLMLQGFPLPNHAKKKLYNVSAGDHLITKIVHINGYIYMKLHWFQNKCLFRFRNFCYDLIECDYILPRSTARVFS